MLNRQNLRVSVNISVIFQDRIEVKLEVYQFAISNIKDPAMNLWVSIF